MTNINWTSTPYLSKSFLSLATHNGVLCGVAVETATLSCGSFDDWAKEEPAIASARRIPRNPISIDLLFMVAPPRISVHVRAAVSIPADSRGEFRHIIANGFGIGLSLPDSVDRGWRNPIGKRPRSKCIDLITAFGVFLWGKRGG